MKHILIVDDDKDIGNLIETMLKKRGGYRVSRAFSGTEALLLMDGAVDYVTKPFHLEELAARIEVHLRENPREKTESAPKSNILTFENLVMDTDNYRLTADGQEVALTRTEYAILKQLMQAPERVITKGISSTASWRTRRTARKARSRCISAICGRS